jgi:hypothetical protein
MGARGSVVGWDTTLQAGRSRVRFPMKSLDFSIDLILQPHHGSGVDSASNINEYQESPDFLENVGSSTSHNLIGLHGLLQG